METKTNPSNKSKLSVALVVLMFLAVSMVAVGFAIKSTLTINDNEFEDKYYVIDVTDETGTVESDSFTLSPSELKVYTDIVLDDGVRTFNAYIEGGNIVQEFYVRTYTNDAPNGTPVSFDLTFATNIETTQYLSQIVDVEHITFVPTPVNGIAGLQKVTLTLPLNAEVVDGVKRIDIKDITGIDFTNFNDVDDLIPVLNTICAETYSVTVNAEPVTA